MKYLNHNCSAKCDYIENSCENVVWNITTQQSDEPRKISSFYSNERTDLMDPLQPKKSLDLNVEDSSEDLDTKVLNLNSNYFFDHIFLSRSLGHQAEA